jgi:predicted O-linked N-acetylglucosamine transferase (SPINDLY family)
MAHQAGGHREAVDYIGRAIAANPHQAGFHVNLGEAYRALGRFEEAKDSYGRAIRLQRDCVQAHNNLGIVFHRQGKLAEAIAAYREALRHRPGYTEARCNLGKAYEEEGKLSDALACYRRAARERPDFATAHVGLGNVLRQQGKLAEAVASYRRALALEPDALLAELGLGMALQELERLDEAEACYRRAVERWPDCPEAHNDLSAVLMDQRRFREAAASAQRALELRPDYVNAHVRLGNVRAEQGDYDQAIACFRRALELEPDHAGVCVNLGNALTNLGEAEEAAAWYSRSAEIMPSDVTRVSAATVLPVIYRSRDEIAFHRGRLVKRLEGLLADGVRLDPTRDTLPTLFYLAYHGLNDRPIQELIARLVGPPSGSGDCAWRRRRGPRIRVGFLSRYFRDHTIGKLTRGLIARLSRRHFEVTVLSLGPSGDEDARRIREHADQYIGLPCRLSAACRTLAEVPLDVLFFPDVGMDSVVSMLARSRWAPVQCVTWGHPVTTGIPTLDWFVSSELLEPDGAAEHYSERLVKLAGLPACYHRPSVPAPLRPREHFGLPSDRHVYLCPQSLFKFHPDFDGALAEILRGDPAGQIAAIRGRPDHWTKLLQQRFRATIPDVADRIVFLPSVSRSDFLSLLAAVDVVLDPFHFGGGNSAYEALAVGTPLVTWPGAFMRGRVTYGCYRRMGVLDCVAADPHQYAEIALRLAADRAWREWVRAKILEANQVLFDNQEAVRQLESLFLDAVERPAA